VLTAFAERWHPETSTFHLPVGELGITLDDVQCLLHIPIQGKFLNHHRMSRSDVADIVSDCLGVEKEDIMAEFAKNKGPHLRFNYLQGIHNELKETCEKMENEEAPLEDMMPYRERCVKAFLLFVVSCTLFTNKSTFYMDASYMQYFQDLSTVHEWNWGAACLVYLQDYLDDASEEGTGQIAGYLSFVMVYKFIN
jgi:hypothetical protein